MLPKIFLSIILPATLLLSAHFPVLFGQNISCNENDYFGCGDLTYINYPFWGGRRPKSCGHSAGFKLVCQDDVPLLNMLSLSYQVQQIDYSTHTLKVTRHDLWNTTCTTFLYNTTTSKDFFLPGDSNGKDIITLFFDCAHHQPEQETLSPNQFICHVGGAKTLNFFSAGNASPGPNITCSNSIFVPVNHGAAQDLKNLTDVQATLASGFSLKWSNNIRPCTYASSCTRGGGSDGAASAPVPSPGVEEPQHSPAIVPSPDSSTESQGLSPSPSHGSSSGTQQHNNPTGNGSFSRPRLLGIIGGLLLGITFTTISTIKIVYCLKRQRSESGAKQKSNHDVEKFILQQGSMAPKRYKYSEIKKITKSFNDKLGQGGYGSVYKGALSDGSLVAVKLLAETDSNGEEFINEVASISRTSHVNIVNLLGFCYDGNKRALVYEFMPNKSLDKFMSNSAEYHLDLEKLYQIAVGVAKGLEYLHTGCNTRIVHFDIKPQNILLDEDFCPKISDFGLAKLCKKKQSILSTLGTRGTVGYIAPEVFSRNFGGVSHKSDVYSYGMMVLDMAGAREIEGIEAIKSSENYFPDKIYEQVILGATRNSDHDFMIEEEEETRRKMILVGFWCIQTTPSVRPSMPKVVELLEGSLQSIQIPPKPFLFCPELKGQEISPSLSEYVETENSDEG